MKPNELMIGDWVLVADDKTPHKIKAISGYVAALDNNYLVKYDEIQPIPLTAEILEKNSFKETFWGDEWTNDNVDFILVEHGDGFRMMNTNIVLTAVHHFQQILRRCGINKEVKL